MSRNEEYYVDVQSSLCIKNNVARKALHRRLGNRKCHDIERYGNLCTWSDSNKCDDTYGTHHSVVKRLSSVGRTNL